MALAANALCTVAEFKTFKGITDSSDNLKIEAIINAVSARVERMVGRGLKAANYVEHVTFGNGTMVLRNWPLLTIDEVRTGSTGRIEVAYEGSAVLARVSVNGTGVRLLTRSAAGTDTATSLTYATYPTLSTMATAITAVSGWTATVVGDDDRSDFLQTISGQDAKTWVVVLNGSCVDSTDRVNLSAGVVTVATASQWGTYDRWDIGNLDHAIVAYRAGYETIPADLVQLGIELTADIYDSSKVSQAVMSESFGTYSYTLADKVKMTDHQRSIINLYGGISLGGGC